MFTIFTDLPKGVWYFVFICSLQPSVCIISVSFYFTHIIESDVFHFLIFILFIIVGIRLSFGVLAYKKSFLNLSFFLWLWHCNRVLFIVMHILWCYKWPNYKQFIEKYSSLKPQIHAFSMKISYFGHNTIIKSLRIKCKTFNEKVSILLFIGLLIFFFPLREKIFNKPELFTRRFGLLLDLHAPFEELYRWIAFSILARIEYIFSNIGPSFIC